MIGAIIGAAVSVGSAVAGGITNAKQAKKQQALLDEQQRDNKNWYDRRYNEDATQRADAQRLIQITQDSINARNKAAAGTDAVMGGTGEAAAKARAQNNQALTNTVSAINAQAAGRKDEIEDKYLAMKHGFNAQQYQVDTARAQNMANAIMAAGSTAGKIASSVDSGGDNSSKSTTTTSANSSNVGNIPTIDVDPNKNLYA